MAYCPPVHCLISLIDVTILQQIDGNPQPSRDNTVDGGKNLTDGNQRGSVQRVLDSREPLAATGLRFTQFGDAVSEPRNLTPCCVAVHDVFLR